MLHPLQFANGSLHAQAAALPSAADGYVLGLWRISRAQLSLANALACRCFFKCTTAVCSNQL